jgi:mRNA interferase HigB
MHVISRKKLREFWAVHPEARTSLDAWYKKLKREEFTTFADVKAVFPQADTFKRFAIFDVGGNKYRIVAEINYTTGQVFLRHALTYAEYTKGRWKDG